jgi:hypothetical protein
MKYRVIERKNGLSGNNVFQVEGLFDVRKRTGLFGLGSTIVQEWRLLDRWGFLWSEYRNSAVDNPTASFNTEAEAVNFIKELIRPSPERVTFETE